MRRLLTCAATFSLACNAVFGVSDLDYGPAGAVQGSGGKSSTGGDDSSSTSAGGGGDETLCVANEIRNCYDGAEGTLPDETNNELTACHAGQQHCLPAGDAFSSCYGQQLPGAHDRCELNADDDCDGKVQQGCADDSFRIAGGRNEYNRALAMTPDGGLVLAGMSTSKSIAVGTDTLSLGPTDFVERLYVLKLDESSEYVGGQAWEIQTGSRIQAVDVDANGQIHVTGYFGGTLNIDDVNLLTTVGGSDEAFWIQLAADGAFEAGEVLAIAGPVRARDLSTQNEFGIVIVGDKVTLGSSGDNGFVHMLSSSGEDWHTDFGVDNGDSDAVTGVAVGSDNEIYITG